MLGKITFLKKQSKTEINARLRDSYAMDLMTAREALRSIANKEHSDPARFADYVLGCLRFVSDERPDCEVKITPK
jgi:hypothetical protein